MAQDADIIVIGGGIAGVSAASALAEGGARVVLLEMEEQLAYHSTGRSAAVFFENYGPLAVRALTRAGRGFFERPPAGFVEHPLVTPRGVLILAEPGQEADLEHWFGEGSTMVPMSAGEALAKVPLLRPERVMAAAWEQDAQDIDVHALHGGFVRRFRAAGGRIVTKAEVRELTPGVGGWTAVSAAGAFSAPVVVNAAGAWADVVAERAGLGTLGLVPKRRTAIIVNGPGDGRGDAAESAVDSSTWPVTGDAPHNWYLRPEAGGKLLVSPADETPVPPCDVQPEEIDIAITVDRFERAVDLPVKRVEHAWAGLRTFAPDEALVIGFDPRAEGFFWLAGQGGYGIQTSPAASRLTAGLIRDGKVPGELETAGVDRAALAPERLIGG
jgi:D-arginine dehydrogenase